MDFFAYLRRCGVPAAAIALSALLMLAARPARAGSPALFDPVPDLLSGKTVTTDTGMLATGGRAVSGVGADGVTEVLVRLPADSAGEEFTATIINDMSNPSTSTDQDGALGLPGAATFTQSSIDVTSSSTSAGDLVFLIYRAPIDFPRPGGADADAAERSVTISVKSQSTATSYSVPVEILRPPLVLIHGLWSGPSTWNNFTPLTTDPRFFIRKADYDFLVGPLLDTTTPDFLLKALARASSLGYFFNAAAVAAEFESYIAEFKNGDNPESIPVAAVQADAVAHSMGGLVARTMALLPTFGSNRTFGWGDLHKLVTVDTPHLGTALGPAILSQANQCTRNLFSAAGNFSFASVTFYLLPGSVDGAMGDLSGDGTGGALSPALAALQPGSTVPIYIPHGPPTAYLASAMSQAQLDGLNNPPNLVLLVKAICYDDPVAGDLTVTGWPKLVGAQSDALVALQSQLNNSTGHQTTAIHSDNTAELGFLPPGALDPVTGNSQAAIDLLNTPLTDPAYTVLR
jgi:pimeloyl-ACP methyl ester carboxylesterase